MLRRTAFFIALGFLIACGDDPAPPKGEECIGELPFETGSDGVSDPLSVPSGQARAGRARPGDLPPHESGLLTWKAGDFILANEKIALVIEDAGESDLYDPWGGRPVGMGRVEDGRLVSPADFGEMFILAGRYTVMTESVTVLADGTDGGPAIVRAEGPMRPLPFFDSITRYVFGTRFDQTRAAIDYVLEPGAEHVDIFLRIRNRGEGALRTGQQMLGYMYLYRMRMWTPSGNGFDTAEGKYDWAGFIGDEGVSYALVTPGRTLTSGVFASGFGSSFGEFPPVPGRCEGELDFHHARLVISDGEGLDAVVRTVARVRGETLRAVSGRVVGTDGKPVAGAVVHADRAGEAFHLTQARTGADGRFELHVPEDDAVDLWVVRRGDRLSGPFTFDADEPDVGDLVASSGGFVVVQPAAELGGGEIPVRVQLYPVGGSAEVMPGRFGARLPENGRIDAAFLMPGELGIFRVPTGKVRVLVSRGFEYDVVEEVIDVAEDNCDPEEDLAACPTVSPVLERVVETPGVMCGDFHIHTIRSNDSADDAEEKLRSAVADGLEIPGRSEHEYVEDWDDILFSLGLERFAYGLTSLELTTFESYGHFGVLPIDADPDAVNGGYIPWQRWPTPANPDVPVEPLTPTELFDGAFARPEDPILIINHPRGSKNYFEVAGLDPMTGLASNPAMWDERFDAIEVFNSKAFSRTSRDVEDWFALLNRGLRVPATGASDSHGIRTSPVGYTRTCLELGMDEPPADPASRRALADAVRDAIRDGRSTVSGGHYLEVGIEDPNTPGVFVGPGGVIRGPFPDCTDGVGKCATIQLRLQVASWIDVDRLEVFVDGESVFSTPIGGVIPDAGPADRFIDTFEIPVTESSRFVVVATEADEPLRIYSGRRPFVVSNPIYLEP